MPTPVIDFNLFSEKYLPPSKRIPKWKIWSKILVSQGLRLYNNFFGFGNYSVKEATAPSFYDSGTTYDFDDIIIYKYEIYQSLTASNTNNRPDINSDPLNENRKWDLISNNFIGLNERSKYTFQKIIIEWGLNHYFIQELSANGFVGFKQPDDPINPTHSDIYINTVLPVYTSFISGSDESSSSYSYSDKSSGYIFSEEVYNTQSSYLCQVNIPSTVYSSINSSHTIADKIIREFLDRYCTSGINYTIVSY